MLEHIHWLGHDAFRIDGPTTIYLDPYQLAPGSPKADLILITHEHADHCSPDDVAKIQKDDTTIVTVASAAEKLDSDQVQIVGPGDEITVKGIRVEAVPAYNVNKFRSPGVPFHPKASGYVGFVVTVGDQRIYHAGDTDYVPEMAELGEIDIALLPVSGKYVMTVDEAVEAARTIQPGLAIPMHVGRGIGSLADANAFKKKAPVEVVVKTVT
ncbi:MAG: MBL fold metallo-hydrolase [Anaerolineae bacterium]|jgi:L-ascorbate metabolism protein UlaG (beta-lactamase superfamily)